MFVISAKLSRVLPVVGLGALAVLAVVLLLANAGAQETGVPVASQVELSSGAAELPVEEMSVTRDAESLADRAAFLRQRGWIIDEKDEVVEAVTIPAEFDAVYTAFNTIQVTQGYDLTAYAGKTAQSYTYRILNYPGTAQDVFVELLVRGGSVIGGEIYSTDNENIRHGLLYESGT